MNCIQSCFHLLSELEDVFSSLPQPLLMAVQGFDLLKAKKVSRLSVKAHILWGIFSKDTSSLEFLYASKVLTFLLEKAENQRVLSILFFNLKDNKEILLQSCSIQVLCH